MELVWSRIISLVKYPMKYADLSITKILTCGLTVLVTTPCNVPAVMYAAPEILVSNLFLQLIERERRRRINKSLLKLDVFLSHSFILHVIGKVILFIPRYEFKYHSQNVVVGIHPSEINSTYVSDMHIIARAVATCITAYPK